MKGEQAEVGVITGASQGIGRAIAIQLAREGVECILAGRTQDPLIALAENIIAEGGKALNMALDLADRRSIAAFTQRINAEFPKLGILINCGGMYSRGPWDRSSAEELDYLLETNVCGAFELTRGLLPLLVRARGDIVFINSTITRGDGKGAGLFAASQHALKGLADSLRAEVNEKGVRVLSVYPGRTATPRQERLYAAEGLTYHPTRLLQPEDVAQAVVACLKLPETAEVTELTIRPRYKH